MVEQSAAEILKSGLLGALLIVSGVVIFLLWRSGRADAAAKDKALADLQSLRVQDAQDVTAKILAVNSECVNAINNATAAIKGQERAIDEVKQAHKELVEEVRALRPRR